MRSAMVALLEREFVMTFKSLASWLSAPLLAFFLTFMPMPATVHAAEDLRKVTVVSFGLLAIKTFFGARRPVQRRSSRAASAVARLS